MSESINDKYSDKNINSDSYVPKLPSMNIKYSDKNIHTVSDVPNLPNIKLGVMTEAALSEERYIKNANLIQLQNIERVSLKESESVVHEYNDTNLDESLNDPSEKAYYNMTPNIVSLRLSGIKIDIPLKKLSLNVSESINTK